MAFKKSEFYSSLWSSCDELRGGTDASQYKDLIVKWQRLMGVKVERFFVQRMKTKWGSCSPGHGSIRLNTELAKKAAGMP